MTEKAKAFIGQKFRIVESAIKPLWFFDKFCGKWLFCCISKASAARNAPLHRHLRNAFFYSTKIA